MMSLVKPAIEEMQTLQDRYKSRLRINASLARFTSARVGGTADALIFVESISDLVDVVKQLWSMSFPFVILGSGSNVLISDSGFRGVVILNRARQIHFDIRQEPPTVWAASGANLGLIARQAAAKSLSGLEWAAGIPGTLGGAVVGNAGAHGEDMSGNLLVAEILHRKLSGSLINNRKQNEDLVIREFWPVERLEYSYRSSSVKRLQRPESMEIPIDSSFAPSQPVAVVLAARMRLCRLRQESIQKKMEENALSRRRSQPSGASMGSMFKNPPDDYAGRLIEAAGLKGTRRGDAEISQLHANFFVNHGKATANEIWELIQLARSTVEKKFGITLDLEIELLGNWNRDYRS